MARPAPPRKQQGHPPQPPLESPLAPPGWPQACLGRTQGPGASPAVSGPVLPGRFSYSPRKDETWALLETKKGLERPRRGAGVSLQSPSTGPSLPASWRFCSLGPASRPWPGALLRYLPTEQPPSAPSCPGHRAPQRAGAEHPSPCIPAPSRHWGHVGKRACGQSLCPATRQRPGATPQERQPRGAGPQGAGSPPALAPPRPRLPITDLTHGGKANQRHPGVAGLHDVEALAFGGGRLGGLQQLGPILGQLRLQQAQVVLGG